MNGWEELKRQTIKLKYEAATVNSELKFFRFIQAFKSGFDPDQPRDERGQWAGDSGDMSSIADSNSQIAARGSAAECDAQYKLDSVICRLVATPLCWQQAMARRAACISGYSLPPLHF